MTILTKSEEEIMHLIWRLGRCTVSDLLDVFGEPKPPHSTVSSVVRILEKKGFVGHKAYGKTHEYFPLVEKSQYAQKTLKDMLQNYYDGSARRLVSHLVQSEKIDEAELRRMLDKLEDLEP